MPVLCNTSYFSCGLSQQLFVTDEEPARQAEGGQPGALGGLGRVWGEEHFWKEHTAFFPTGSGWPGDMPGDPVSAAGVPADPKPHT